MRPKQRILEFIQKAYEDDHADKPVPGTETLTRDERLAVREMFDGMSTGTARIVIEEELDDQLAEAYCIDTLVNRGRYYAARIVRPDGSAIRRLLVDKQTGSVQFVGG